MRPAKQAERGRSPSVATELSGEVLGGGGEMGALMRSMDWSRTPLGPVEGWSQALRLHAEPRRLVGQWDRARLDRVLTNLVGNAIKYSPAGGDVLIDISCIVEDGREWALLSVQDQGLGIPPTDRERIFERFHRAANVSDNITGSGIGLAYVREIVERHGGSVSLASEEGDGSTFTVRLPIEPSPPRSTVGSVC